MRHEDTLNQRASRVIFLVCTLIELIGCATTSSSSALLLFHVTQDILLCNILLTGCLGSSLETLRLLWDCLERLLRSLAESLAFLGFNLALLRSNCVLILTEVSAVKGLERREPDFNGGAEIGVLLLRVKHGVHRVLHEVQVLKVGELGADIHEEVVQYADPVVGETECLKFVQSWERVHVCDVVVVQDQHLQVGEHIKCLHIVNLVETEIYFNYRRCFGLRGSLELL